MFFMNAVSLCANDQLVKKYIFPLNSNVKDIGWSYQGKIIGVSKTDFKIIKCPDGTNGSVLRVEANCASGMIMNMPSIDPNQYPVIRWRWRLIKPININAHSIEPDDQAIVIYVGDGGVINRRSVGYRWEHNHQIGTNNLLTYAGGTVSVQRFCLQNHTTPIGKWITEERNYAKDYQKAFKRTINKKFIVGIGGNSQHSKSHTIAEVDYIEFRQLPAKKL